jgi:hypothetical protein
MKFAFISGRNKIMQILKYMLIATIYCILMLNSVYALNEEKIIFIKYLDNLGHEYDGLKINELIEKLSVVRNNLYKEIKKIKADQIEDNHDYIDNSNKLIQNLIEEGIGTEDANELANIWQSIIVFNKYMKGSYELLQKYLNYCEQSELFKKVFNPIINMLDDKITEYIFYYTWEDFSAYLNNTGSKDLEAVATIY